MKAVALTLLTLLLSVSLAQEITVHHAQGETVVPLHPEKVFSFDYAAIDTLQALGVKVEGMPPLELTGPTAYASDDTINIGSLFEPDYERINAEAPDLIIVGGRTAEAYDQLSQIAPTIDLSFVGEDFLAELTQNTETLAQIFAKEAEAEAALGELNAQIDGLKTKVAEGGNGLVIMTSGGSVSVLAPHNERAGRGSFIYQTLGLTPTVEDIETATHGEPISFEFLLEHNPERLFVIDRDAATGESEGQPAEQVLDNALVHETTAWQEEHIVYLNPFDNYIITGAGLQSLQRMIDEVAAAY